MTSNTTQVTPEQPNGRPTTLSAPSQHNLPAILRRLPQPPLNTTSPPGPPISTSIIVPTLTPTLSSGFPYPTQLSPPATDITPSIWALFSNTLISAARLSRTEQSRALFRGIGRGVVLLGGPQKGQESAERERRKMEIAKVGREGGRIAGVIAAWNLDFFERRGLRLRVLMPEGDGRDAQKHTKRGSILSRERGARTRKEEAVVEGLEREIANGRFRICVEPVVDSPLTK